MEFNLVPFSYLALQILLITSFSLVLHFHAVATVGEFCIGVLGAFVSMNFCVWKADVE